jgi:hypothetical protein
MELAITTAIESLGQQQPSFVVVVVGNLIRLANEAESGDAFAR